MRKGPRTQRWRAGISASYFSLFSFTIVLYHNKVKHFSAKCESLRCLIARPNWRFNNNIVLGIRNELQSWDECHN